MRERIKDRGRLEHIMSSIDILLSNKSKYSLQELMEDSILFYGFVKHVEIIGEAVYMLTKEFKNAHPEVEWDVIEGMRHVLVHGYYKIRPEQLWETIESDIPELNLILKGICRNVNKHHIYTNKGASP